MTLKYSIPFVDVMFKKIRKVSETYMSAIQKVSINIFFTIKRSKTIKVKLSLKMLSCFIRFNIILECTLLQTLVKPLCR